MTSAGVAVVHMDCVVMFAMSAILAKVAAKQVVACVSTRDAACDRTWNVWAALRDSAERLEI